jgi:hypothetical protein
MKIIIFVIALFVAGCSFNESSNVCNFNIKSSEWKRVEKSSNNKIKPVHESVNSNWYRNTNGDYLICHDVRSHEVCGGIYEQFTKQQDGSFVNSEIFCME